MKAEINVTPLIDVLLVLLIIFIVVTPLAPSALDAALPEPGGPGPASRSGVVLRVDREAFAVDGAPALDHAALERLLQAALDARRERTLFVRVGEGVRYARVVGVIDLARRCGAGRIGLVDATGEPEP